MGGVNGDGTSIRKCKKMMMRASEGVNFNSFPNSLVFPADGFRALELTFPSWIWPTAGLGSSNSPADGTQGCPTPAPALPGEKEIQTMEHLPKGERK